MRHGMNASLIKIDNGVVGVNLGADSVSEHEWGIGDIKQYLGINDKIGMGLDCRKVQKQSPLLVWIDKKKIGKGNYSGFALYRFWDGIENWTPREFYHSNKEKNLYTGWSKDGFYVLTESKDKDSVSSLNSVYEALNSNNACIWLGGGGVFNNSGLCIGIVDKMPKEIFDKWYAADKDRVELQAEFDATGIEKLLRAAKKDWFYLGPKRNSEGKMIIWLNPMEQRIHNSGYFTIKELKQWAHNTGRVMKSEDEKKAH